MFRPTTHFSFHEVVCPRSSKRESLIAAVSIAILVWAIWPRQPDQRIVQARLVGGETQSFSLPVGDQRLAQIQKRIDGWRIREPLAEIGRTRWALEAANHYAALRSKQGPTAKADHNPKTVLHASFTLPGDPISDHPTLTPPASDPAIIDWQSAVERQTQRLETIQQRVTAAKDALGPPPFAISDVTPGPRPTMAVAVAVVAAVIAFIAFTWWQRVAPPIRLEFGHETEPGGDRQDHETSFVKMHIPVNWMHLHQPAAVVARSVAVAVLLAGAIVVPWRF